MSFDADLTERVRKASSVEGFARVGVAEARRLDEESTHLDAWLAAGRHGDMGWMERTAEVRKDPRHPKMLSEARSVVVLVAPYLRQSDLAGPPPARVAKYAQGRDYHNVLTKKARRVSKLLSDAGHPSRVAVDSKPVFERAWAERAGVGFVGKNCCLIVPGLGSHVFLACIVTGAALRPDPPMQRRCGDCTLCLDACPTGAFVDERTLDARKCITYLTIEPKGPIPEAYRDRLGEWMFGCDVCQDVCPYNQGARQDAPFEAFEPGGRWNELEASDLLRMDESRFSAWAEGSALKRAKREGLARNIALVLGNRGEARHLPLLDEARIGDASEVVREAAAWAYQQLSRRLGVEE